MSVDFLSKNFPPFQVHHAKKPPRFYPDGFQRNVIDFYFIFSDCRLRKALYLQFSYFIWPLGNAHANKGHAISHAVGSLTHAPHAVCVACNLPFIAEKLTPAYYRRIRNVVKEVFGKEVDDNISADELGKLINGCIRQFELDIKCPSIKAYGATRQQIMDSAPLIMSDKLFHTGRVSMSREELEQVLTDVCKYYGLN